MRRKQAGFTILEVVMAMTAIGICLGIAIPALQGAAAAVHAGTAKTALGATLLSAMSHATVTGTEVVVCASSDGGDCNDSIDWSPGWIAFADLDGNRSRGANETLLRSEPGLHPGIHLRSTTGRRRIVLRPQGGMAAGSNVTFTLCDRRGPAKATTLVLANSGRLRQDKASAASAQACMAPG